MDGMLGLLLVVVAHSSFAPTAETPPPDEELRKEGIGLRRAGQDAEALAVFERALAIDGSPRTRAQVGLAEEALGLWVESERDLSSALAAGTDAWFQQHRETLERALTSIRAHLASLEVATNVASAELRIDGAHVGELPLQRALRVASGRLTIEVRAEGFETQRRTVSVDPGVSRREFVELVKVSVAEPRSPVATGLAPGEPNAPAPSRHEYVVTTDQGAGMRSAGSTLLGGAAALLAGAGVALLVHNSNAALYNDDSRCFYGGLTRDQRCGGYRDAASTAQTVAVIELSGAALAAGASFLFYALTPKAPVFRIGAETWRAGAGLTCSTSF